MLEALFDKNEFWSREEVWEHLEQAFKGSGKLFEVIGQKPRSRLKRERKRS